MAVDKVKPLKIENPASGGTQTDMYPTETNPAADYLAAKGIAFENLDTFLVQKLGRVLTSLEPDLTEALHYLANGELDYLEVFNSATQITANRILRADMTYNASIDPTVEVWLVYATDGTTVLRTITYTYTYSSNNITDVSMVTT